MTDYDPTIENTYRKMIRVNGYDQMTEILDTAGQEEYGGMRESYYRMGDGFVIVFSVTQRETLDSVETMIGQIYRVKEATKYPIVVAANKIDLVDERKISQAEVAELRKKLDVTVLEVSAKTRINVEETFSAVVKEVIDSTGANTESNASSEPYRIKKKKRCCIQ